MTTNLRSDYREKFLLFSDLNKITFEYQEELLRDAKLNMLIFDCINITSHDIKTYLFYMDHLLKTTTSLNKITLITLIILSLSSKELQQIKQVFIPISKKTVVIQKDYLNILTKLIWINKIITDAIKQILI